MAAAEELYSTRPDEFVPRRTELAAEAKGDGGKTLVAEIKKLPKPVTAAWTVNMLVRHEPDQVEQVLALGSALREAQATMAGEELRRLGRQRRQLVAAVARRARVVAADLGQKLGDPVVTQVEETLHAAMVDDDAAAAVRTGMLVKPLAPAGTEVAGVAESVAVPSAIGADVVRRAPARRTARAAPAKPELTVVEDDTAAIEEAEQALAEAESELAAARRQWEKAQRKVEKREAKELQLHAEVDELRRRLAEVEKRVEDNEDQLSDAEEARDDREEAVAEAQAAVDRARKALGSLR